MGLLLKIPTLYRENIDLNRIALIFVNKEIHLEIFHCITEWIESKHALVNRINMRNWKLSVFQGNRNTTDTDNIASNWPLIASVVKICKKKPFFSNFCEFCHPKNKRGRRRVIDVLISWIDKEVTRINVTNRNVCFF